MAAPQGWSKLYDDLATHPKFVAAGGDAAWLYICGQCYSSGHLTDGRIPKAMVPRLSDRRHPDRLAAELVKVGLWEDAGDHYQQHDYTEMQTTREEREAGRDDARERQRRSRHNRDRHKDVTRDNAVTHDKVTPDVTASSRDCSLAEVEVESHLRDSTRARSGAVENPDQPRTPETLAVGNAALAQMRQQYGHNRPLRQGQGSHEPRG